MQERWGTLDVACGGAGGGGGGGPEKEGGQPMMEGWGGVDRLLYASPRRGVTKTYHNNSHGEIPPAKHSSGRHRGLVCRRQKSGSTFPIGMLLYPKGHTHTEP